MWYINHLRRRFYLRVFQWIPFRRSAVSWFLGFSGSIPCVLFVESTQSSFFVLAVSRRFRQSPARPFIFVFFLAVFIFISSTSSILNLDHSLLSNFPPVWFPSSRFIIGCVTDWHMPAGESNVCCGEVAGLAHLSSWDSKSHLSCGSPCHLIYFFEGRGRWGTGRGIRFKELWSRGIWVLDSGISLRFFWIFFSASPSQVDECRFYSLAPAFFGAGDLWICLGYRVYILDSSHIVSIDLPSSPGLLTGATLG